MFIIIPIGGIGKRFQDENYTRPKPLINVLGKPVLFWVLDNLKFEKEDTLVIVYNNYLEQFNFENIVFHRYRTVVPIIFVPIYQQTTGASHTLSLALKNIDHNEKFISLDCDSFYTCDILKLCRNSPDNNIIYFEDYDEKPIYSYIKINSQGIISEIKEKVKISNNANTGCYMFSSGKLFLEYFKKLMTIGNCETYTSYVYLEMLKDNVKISSIKIEKFDFHCLGTPFQQKIFSMDKNFHKEKYRFCFDLDGTLVSHPFVKGDYTSVKPIQKNIDFLNFLKNNGHTIIIYTARRMKTHGGNVGKVMSDIAKITFDNLEKFNINYDEIYFGKPYADFYIDDLSINFNESLDKATGFYDMMIEPRDFNTIKEGTISTIIKKSSKEKLKGQIYFYKNMPTEISHLFPKLYSYSDKHYEIEKIIGIPLSYQFIDGNLKIDTLKKVLECLEKIHTCQGGVEWRSEGGEVVDIHSNFLPKIKKRYEENREFYKTFKNSENIFTNLCNFFETYKGVKGIIHGDPVFSNILITEKDELKFIDMRGMLGDISTICGDIFYDYAKIYQSLLGYDFILLDKPIKINLDLVKYFESYILEKFNKNILENIKMITKSLIFSLLPLHKSEATKCEMYYKLICI